MHSINPIEKLINVLASTGAKPVQAINSKKKRANVILIDFSRSTISFLPEKKVSFLCYCEAFILGKIELNVIGELSKAIRECEIEQEEGEVIKIENVSKTERIQMFGDNQIECSLEFSYYLETSYNENVTPLESINWKGD